MSGDQAAGDSAAAPSKVAAFIFSDALDVYSGSVTLVPKHYSLDELRQALPDIVRAARFSESDIGHGKMYVLDYTGNYPDRPKPPTRPIMPVGSPVAVTPEKCIVLDLLRCVPAGAAGGGGGGDEAAHIPKRRNVTFDVPPPGMIITVRDLEVAHISVSMAVPDTWDAFLARLQSMCGYTDAHRLYYTTIGFEPKTLKLATQSDFSLYLSTMEAAGRLPDLWILRSALETSPEKLPSANFKDDASGKKSSNSRNSAQQTDFRNALLLRDSDGLCAICESDEVQAAHILPQGQSEYFTSNDDLLTTMKAVGLFSLYDVRNGILLCDQCHDFFDAYLWTVDSERKVVISDALATNVPKMATYAGKQLFPESTTTSLTRSSQPLPGLWEWHFKTYALARDSRHLIVKNKFFFCDKCKKPYAREKAMISHQNTCTAMSVPHKNFYTPAGAGGGVIGRPSGVA